MNVLSRIRNSLSYRLPLIWAALFFNGDRLQKALPRREVEIFAWGNLFEQVPGLRSWEGAPPRFSLAQSRSAEKPLSTELDVIRLIYDLCRFVRAKSVVEVGIYKGACSLAMAGALVDNGGGDIHCVDICDDSFSEIKSAIDDLRGSVRSHFHKGDSAAIASSGVVPVSDLIFIDADHRYEPAKKDFREYWNLLAPGGVLVMHDTVMWDGTRQAANEQFQQGIKTLTMATSGGSGISVIFKPKH